MSRAVFMAGFWVSDVFTSGAIVSFAMTLNHFLYYEKNKK
jgi:hypothetical protein